MLYLKIVNNFMCTSPFRLSDTQLNPSQTRQQVNNFYTLKQFDLCNHGLQELGYQDILYFP